MNTIIVLKTPKACVLKQRTIASAVFTMILSIHGILHFKKLLKQFAIETSEENRYHYITSKNPCIYKNKNKHFKH